jgi:dihydropteroate synthase
VIFAYRSGVWDLSERPRVVGILNLTPDSFYDGGRYESPELALERAERMIAEGADGVDLGGQSTRPGGEPVGAEKEWRRIEPTLALLRRRVGAPISIDTYHGEVARRALDCGADVVNDVTGLTADPTIADHVARAGAGLVLTHSLGAPADLHEPRKYEDVAAEVRAFLERQIRVAESRGVARERIAVDPGIGFSKRARQSIAALRGIPALRGLGRPVYVGVSRKSFLSAITGQPAEARLAAGLGATLAAYSLGAGIFRTHDVRETLDALRAAEALLGDAESSAPVGSGAEA